MSHSMKLFSTVCASVICIASQAKANILCDGDFQIVDGSSVSTPYCQDEHLAVYQRKAGLKISGTDVRRRPEVKSQACAFASGQYETACASDLND